jgi:hypothetical protein
VALDASVLTKKIGPLPAYAWGGLAAGAIWWFLIRGKTGASSTGTTNAAASGSALNSGYGLGYAQGVQANPPPSAPSTTSKNRVVLIAPAGEPGPNHKVAVWSAPSTSSGQVGVYPAGTTLDANGPAVQGTSFGPYYDLPQSDQWVPVTTPDGRQGYVWGPATAIAAAVAAIGGAARSIGSRSATLMSAHHPLITAPHPLPHFVRKVGGAANHSGEVARVSKQAGVHPARMMMLNPDPNTSYLRVA